MSEDDDEYGWDEAPVEVTFNDDGGVRFKVGNWSHLLSAKQVAKLRELLGVGTLTIVNDSVQNLDYRLIAGKVRPGAGRDYRLELYTPGQPKPAPALQPPISINRPITKRRPPR